MSFSPFKLYTQYRPDIEHFTPFSERTYTLTHSDQTGDLFLTVSKEFATDQTNEMRDEVFGWWTQPKNNQVQFQGSVLVGTEDIPETAQQIRYQIFMREMSTALKGIFYGERWLLETYPFLKESPIWIQFRSNLPQYSGNIYFGTVKDYM
ncbi:MULTISPECIES: staygreen family protein [Pontibacillus]|uniref:Staygreen family protein n=1 Tax=Pontibacillus chungwhensis TaxID=265426 RepID=A0ABY8UYX0_9BACI|nr:MULTISPECIES: staygreen family protein [Pontibacillus]MCD5324923.1 staygreen family protein [Pontibacillus sp. HN14]WIF98882.1 staygreen family protein [Pontibacillus chungwhensis]